jgi:hypothetical protein
MQSSREAIAEYLLDVTVEAWVKSGFFAIITLAEFSSNEVVLCDENADLDGGTCRFWPTAHEVYLVELMKLGRV